MGLKRMMVGRLAGGGGGGGGGGPVITFESGRTIDYDPGAGPGQLTLYWNLNGDTIEVVDGLFHVYTFDSGAVVVPPIDGAEYLQGGLAEDWEIRVTQTDSATNANSDFTTSFTLGSWDSLSSWHYMVLDQLGAGTHFKEFTIEYRLAASPGTVYTYTGIQITVLGYTA